MLSSDVLSTPTQQGKGLGTGKLARVLGKSSNFEVTVMRSARNEN